ncbi:MAG: BspA family leucine-rich repeat surface protein [Paludibacteraceae bacterium]|nr:BspA family leucine-rich repeat surface protein [Paludibacteraceae bacterium]
MKKLLFLLLGCLSVAGVWAQGAKEAYTVFDGTDKLTFYYDDRKDSREGTVELLTKDDRLASYAYQVKSILIDSSFKDYELTNTGSLFNNVMLLTFLDNVTFINGMEYVNAEKATDLSGMFRGLSSLESIDLSQFHAPVAENLEDMFSSCSNLKSVDLSQLGAEWVSNVSYMFYACSKLESVDISGLANSNITKARNMFYLCTNLKTLDLTECRFDFLEDAAYMFYGCLELTTIYCNEDWSVNSILTNDDNIFLDCSKLKGHRSTVYNSSKVNKVWARPDGGAGSEGYFTTSETYAVVDGTVLTLYNDFNKEENGGVTDWWSQSSITSSVTKIIIDESCQNARPTNMSYWFAYFSQLDSIIGLDNVNTGYVTNMSYLFFGSQKLSYIDWNPSDALAVQDMSYMFGNCQSLTAVDLSDLTTSVQLQSTACMFIGCSALKSLRLSKSFSTVGVTSMSHMFRDCGSLVTFPVEQFDVHNVIHMSSMFENCYSLGVLDLSEWKTSSLAYAENMFKYCYQLSTLNLSGFDMTKAVDASEMFRDCSSLRYIIYDGDWSGLAGLSSATDMFTGCSSLTGGAGTKYNEGHKDRSWARTDGGEGSEGYFCTTAPKFYAVASDDDKTLIFYYDLDKDKNGGVGEWDSYNENVTKIVFDSSVKDARPTSTASWFYSFSELEEFEHLDYLNTDVVTDMAGMFSQCRSVKSLDLSNFKTGNVTNMERMFEGCAKLEDVALYNFDTRSVTDMSAMFDNCYNLTSLDLYSFNTGNVTDMKFMFSNCLALKRLDVSKFDTRNVTTMESMFSNCRTLTTIYLSNFNINNVTDMSQMFSWCDALAYIVCDKDWSKSEAASNGMFQNCLSLRGEAGTKYDAEYGSYDKTYARPDGGEGNEGFFCTKKPEIYFLATNEGKTLTFYYDTRKEELGGDSFWADEMFRNAVTEIILDTTMVFYRPFDLSFWLSDFKELKEIKHLGYLNTSDVTNMMTMFKGCCKLESLDLSCFNTSRVSVLAEMFKGCTALRSIDLTAFDFSNVTDLTEMFAGCTALETVDLRTWHSSEFSPTFRKMFEECSALKNIYCFADWTALDPSMAEDMFKGCTNLKGHNGTAFSGSHTDNTWARLDGGEGSEGYFRLIEGKDAYTAYDAKTTTLTFHYDNLCMSDKDALYENLKARNEGAAYDKDITKVVFDEAFAEARPADLSNWFSGCENLAAIEGIEFLNTSEATDMSYMFRGCAALESLDLKHFDMGKVTNANQMFFVCTALKTILCDGNWGAMENIWQSSDMFYGCEALVGGKGTAYNSSCTDKSYARPDRGESAPGYFTGKPAYTVTLNAKEGGKAVVKENINLNDVPEGTVLHLTAKPDYGYDFVNWSDEVTAAEREITVTSDITLTASFAPKTFTLTVKVTPEEGGKVIVGGLSESNTGLYTTEFTLEAVPNEGYEFDAWYEGEMKLESAEAKTSSVLIGDMTMTCAFRKKGATDLDQTTAPEGEATKLLRNGILYIIRNGRIYDTTGRQLR